MCLEQKQRELLRRHSDKIWSSRTTADAGAQIALLGALGWCLWGANHRRQWEVPEFTQKIAERGKLDVSTRRKIQVLKSNRRKGNRIWVRWKTHRNILNDKLQPDRRSIFKFFACLNTCSERLLLLEINSIIYTWFEGVLLCSNQILFSWE